jgi:hypothetical protein
MCSFGPVLGIREQHRLGAAEMADAGHEAGPGDLHVDAPAHRLEEDRRAVHREGEGDARQLARSASPPSSWNWRSGCAGGARRCAAGGGRARRPRRSRTAGRAAPRARPPERSASHSARSQRPGEARSSWAWSESRRAGFASASSTCRRWSRRPPSARGPHGARGRCGARSRCSTVSPSSRRARISRSTKVSVARGNSPVR